jgi:acid phosphatase (class A)
MKNVARVSSAVLTSTVLMWSQPAAPPERVRGYLTSDQTSSVVRIVPPAPTTGDARYQADMAIFSDTRSLKGSARWTLAQSDDNLSTIGLLRAFRCALGLTLTPDNAPALTAILQRANTDAGAAVNVLKVRYQHKRPFQVAEGDVCVSQRNKASLERSPDYASKHAGLGWETGLILAALVPEAASDVLARGRAFGQSRIVCGVHNTSAVEAGWMAAAAIFSMQAGTPEFRRDLDAARTELSDLRARTKSKPAGCKSEAETLSQSPY